MAELSEYKITMVTLDSPPPIGSSTNTVFEPWYRQNSFTMSGARVSTVAVLDDDPNFEVPRYSTDLEQFLVSDTAFGPDLVAAGNRLSVFRGSIIKDADGNRFLANFPFINGTRGSFGNMVGGRKAILVTPLPVTDASTGKTTFPKFDVNATFSYVSEKGFGNGYASVAYAPQAAICFTAGTMIETMFGAQAIETLSAGDMVLTRDNGFRVLRWIGSTLLDRGRLDLQPHLRPILIRADALAPGFPSRDLRVSPQHRVLVRSVIARRMFGEDEILVAAKHLLGLPGIEIVNPALGVSYHHMLFDDHEVVRSNGAWTESLYTGPEALKAVSGAARREILALFPHLSDPGFRSTGARRLLNGREGRKLAQRHVKNSRQLVNEA